MLPSNGKLYSKVISWVQRSLWENGEPLERLMEEVSVHPSLTLPPSLPSFTVLFPSIMCGWLLMRQC